MILSQNIFYLLTLSWACFGPGIVRASNEVYARLITDLFANYVKEIRPAKNQLLASTVRLSMQLTAINDLEEKNQVFVSTVAITVNYFDDFLSWNQSDYGGLTHIIYPQDKVWVPDLVVENSVEKLAALGYSGMNVFIHSRGRVLWRPGEILRTSCAIDVTYYPFDTQTCSIVLTTWMSKSSEVLLMIDSFQDRQLAVYEESGAWDLVNISVRDVSGTKILGSNRISFDFTIRRRKAYYIVNLIIPVITLSTTSSLVFALPAAAGEKMGMSITVLLAYAVYLTIISDSMPRTSMQVSIMGVYLSLLLVATAMGVVSSVFVLAIHHRDEDNMPPGAKWAMFLRLRPFLGLHDLCNNSNNSSNPTKINHGTKAIDNNQGKPSSNTLTKIGDKQQKIDSSSMLTGVKWITLSRFRLNKVGHTHTQHPVTEKKTDQSEDKNIVYDAVALATEEVKVSWGHVSETVDRLLFVVFTTFTVVSSAIFGEAPVYPRPPTGILSEDSANVPWARRSTFANGESQAMTSSTSVQYGDSSPLSVSKSLKKLTIGIVPLVHSHLQNNHKQ